MSIQKRIIQEYETNIVYLIQAPRAGCVPSLSPFALKLETWLRMADIEYQNVNNEFKHKSVEGFVPFVELNGRQIVESNAIINELSAHFNIRMDEIALKGINDDTENFTNNVNNFLINRTYSINNLTPEIAKKISEFYAYRSLIEDSLRWKCKYYRAINNLFYGTKDGIGSHFHGFKKFIFKHFYLMLMRRKNMRKCKIQGIGNLTSDKVDMITRHELKSLSIFLGNKLYFLGDYHSTLDAIAFGILCMFYYSPMNTSIRNYLESDCMNLISFLQNMKRKFWPDWIDATEKLIMKNQRQIKIPIAVLLNNEEVQQNNEEINHQ